MCTKFLCLLIATNLIEDSESELLSSVVVLKMTRKLTTALSINCKEADV